MNERPTHIGEDGKARMVDVGGKQQSERMARALSPKSSDQLLSSQ